MTIPSERKEIKYLERKAKAVEASYWVQSQVAQAYGEGRDEVLVKTSDLRDLLAFVMSHEARDKIEFEGKPLGFARPEDMRNMLAGRIQGICVKKVRGSQFNCAVTYVQLPEYSTEPEKELQSEDQ